MGNTFGAKGLFDRFEPTRFMIEESKAVVHEGDEPDSIAHLLDPHVLTGEALA